MCTYPWKISLTVAETSTLLGSRTCPAPMVTACARRAVDGSETIISRTPFALRQSITASPIGPVPKTMADWPSLIPEFDTACQATARGSIKAPASRLMPSGRTWQTLAGITMLSHKPPGFVESPRKADWSQMLRLRMEQA